MSEERDSENDEKAKLPPSKKAPAPTDPPGLLPAAKTKFAPSASAPPFTARKLDSPESGGDPDAPGAENDTDLPANPDGGSEVERIKVQKKREVAPELADPKSFPWRKAGQIVLGFFFLILFTLVVFWMGYERGVTRGMKLGDETAAMGGMQLPPEISAALDEALVDLRKGDAKSAVKKLQVLEKTPPGYPSVTYLIALAAMQDGNIDLSEKKSDESISKRERISDSLALQAVLETQKASDPTRPKMVDPRRRAELLLRQAIIADAANPYPHFELATLLRYRGEREEALREVYAAQARLNPVDSHMIMELTSAIMELEALPKEKLPTVAPDSDDIRKLFPAAYAAMRRSDFASATTILRKCRKLSSPDIFDYAVNDPAIRKYSRQPELAEFFEQAP